MSTGAGVPVSIAATDVHRPSPESETRPAKPVEAWRGDERRGSEVEEPRRHDAAATPELRDGGEVEGIAVELGKRERRGLGVSFALLEPCARVLEDAEPFREGGHEPVLDAVVDHLHEVPGAALAAVEIAVLLRGDLVPARRARGCVDPRRERREDRLEPPERVLVAADHQAEPALEPEDAPARPAVEVVDPARSELLGAADVVRVVRVAAVDDRVSRLQALCRARRRHLR